jgi:hypothetical protein
MEKVRRSKGLVFVKLPSRALLANNRHIRGHSGRDIAFFLRFPVRCALCSPLCFPKVELASGRPLGAPPSSGVKKTKQKQDVHHFAV